MIDLCEEQTQSQPPSSDLQHIQKLQSETGLHQRWL